MCHSDILSRYYGGYTKPAPLLQLPIGQLQREDPRTPLRSPEFLWLQSLLILACSNSVGLSGPWRITPLPAFFFLFLFFCPSEDIIYPSDCKWQKTQVQPVVASGSLGSRGDCGEVNKNQDLAQCPSGLPWQGHTVLASEGHKQHLQWETLRQVDYPDVSGPGWPKRGTNSHCSSSILLTLKSSFFCLQQSYMLVIQNFSTMEITYCRK